MARRYAWRAALAAFFVAAFTLAGWTWGDKAQAQVSYLFDDEFGGAAGTAPDPAKWNVTNGCATSADLQYTCYNPANVYQDGAGHLVLKVSNGTMGRPYDGVSIQTFTETGWPPQTVLWEGSPPIYIQARIMFARGRGLWGAYWFNSDSGGGLSNLELDVQEYRGNVPTIDTCHAHLMTEWGATIDTGLPLYGAYHTYWMRYYSDHVTFGVDGLTCGTTTLANAPPEMIRLWHIVGVPGTWGGAGGPPPASRIPALMFVDYVRAWRL